jgi:hypothetical protein
MWLMHMVSAFFDKNSQTTKLYLTCWKGQVDVVDAHGERLL